MYCEEALACAELRHGYMPRPLKINETHAVDVASESRTNERINAF